MSLHNIPVELRNRPQWVCATGVPAEDDPQGKAPRNPRNGQLAVVTDPGTWATFEEACRTGMRHVGYVLSPNDPYSAIDLDDPASEEQRVRHVHILEAAESYAEVSQSGKGVHIFVRGTVPNGVRRDKVEVYSSGRYMICTGNALNQLPIAERQELLDILYREMRSTATVELAEQDALLSDEDLWTMGSKAVNGAKFEQLWAGDWEKDYPSQSEADFALMAMLCYYSKSNEQCRRMFRMSGLGKRDKAMRTKYLDYMVAKCRSHEPPTVDLDAIRAREVPAPTALTVTSNEPKPKPKPKPPSGPKLATPPGLIGAIADYAFTSSIRPAKEIALATALALTAGIAGRSYNVSGTGLNQYFVLLARTGSGKEGAATAIDTLVAALRPTLPLVDRFIGPAMFASGQALVRVLDERPCFVSILGEFSATLQSICDPRANDGLRMLKRVLLDIYNKSGFNKVVRPSVYSDTEKNTKMVQAPAVTVLGESTPEELYGHLDASHVTSGLLPRFSIIEYNGPRPVKNRNAFHPPSEELLNALGELVTIALTTQQNRTCCPVCVDTAASGVFAELDEHADRVINQSGEVDRHLWNRADLKAMKLGALLAVGVDAQQPVISKGMAEWARDFVVADITNLSAKFAEGDVGEGYSKQEVDLKTAIRSYLSMDTKSRVGYKIPEKLAAEKGVIPFHFLRRRLRMVASFKNDRRGFTTALEDQLDNLVKAETLLLVDRRTSAEAFGVTQPLYAIGPTF